MKGRRRARLPRKHFMFPMPAKTFGILSYFAFDGYIEKKAEIFISIFAVVCIIRKHILHTVLLAS